MFAVPGWKLGELKSYVEEPVSSDGSKKRKRKKQDDRGIANEDDMDALYKRHIEGIIPEKKTKGKKRQKSSQEQESEKVKEKASENEDAEEESKKKPTTTIAEIETQKLSRRERKLEAKLRREKEEKPNGLQSQLETTTITDPTTNPNHEATTNTNMISTTKPILPKLTPMQAAMRQKLISARFRHLNQTLYTSPSNQAGRLFDENPTFFEEYHSGFRQQVSTWPENPVDGFVEDIKRRANIPALSRDKDKDKTGMPGPTSSSSSSSAVTPLPRTKGTCTISDMGCGDAKLAQQLLRDSKMLQIKLTSFDLHSPSALVRKADISNLPLEDGSVNIAVLCLALMGTNWIEFIDEAWRILHWKGELWVAEIKSRFMNPAKGGNKKGRNVVQHSVGNRKKKGLLSSSSSSKKSGVEDDEQGIQQTLHVLVDGAEDATNKTDVSAFVEVLKKRGFVLHGDNAVDMGNKMFVKMRFAKALAPIKGKNVGKDAGGRGTIGRGGRGGGGTELGLVEDEDKIGGDGGGIDEASVLKPCLYKIR